jgi:RNA polymerase sigma factor (sigma-70 family)
VAATGDDLGHAYAQALYGRYYSNVYRYALSQLRSPEDAEDAAQNTFLRAFAALQKGVVPESEAAWLFKIAHNVCASSKLAWLRRRRIELPRDLDELQVARPESNVDVSGLDDALAAMPPRLREAFLLREWQGLSYAEIAERLDTSRSAVETLIFRARRHLATELRKAQSALTLGPIANWLRGLLANGAALRGVGVVALATGAAAATTLATTPREKPARARPQQTGARADLVPAASLPLAYAATRTAARTAGVRTPAAGAAAPASVPAAPAGAPTVTGGATSGSTATTNPAPAPAPALPTPPSAMLPGVTLAAPPAPPPTVTAPPVTVPAVTVPAVIVPSVTAPPVTTPAVTTPSVTTPSVTVSSPLP